MTHPEGFNDNSGSLFASQKFIWAQTSPSLLDSMFCKLYE